jgi:hypothetical protein
MSLLDRLRPAAGAASPPSGDDQPVGPAVAAGLGVWTAALGWVAVALPILLAWATSAQTRATWPQAVRVATDGWLAMHRVGLGIPGGTIALTPLGGLGLLGWLCWLAGRRIGAGLPRPGREPTSALWAAGPALAGLAAGYAASLTLAGWLAGDGDARPQVWQAMVIGLVLPAVAGSLGVLRGAGHPVGPGLAQVLRLSDRARRVAGPAVRSVAALFAAGAVVAVVAVVGHLDRVLALYRALDPGAQGALVLTLLQLTALPNLALWALAFLAGPGFAVGVGTTVSPGGSSVGLLPLVPVLGALPEPGPAPGWWMAVLAGPVLVGAWAGWQVARPGATPVGDAVPAGRLGVLTDAVVCALLTSGVLTALLALSGGAAGPGRLATVGPSPWRVGLALATELAAGAVVAAWLTHRRGSR